MKRIGITGGIACGKSEVVRILRDLGACVTDADALSRASTAPGGPALAEIRGAFGLSYFDQEGRLNRRMLGEMVFRDAAARERLEGIIHPIVRREMEKELAAYRAKDAPFAFLDIPLLFETGMQDICDLVWVVSAPLETQLARLIARDHLTPEAALIRIRSQMPTEQKEALADVVIRNQGGLEELRRQVSALYRALQDK